MVHMIVMTYNLSLPFVSLSTLLLPHLSVSAESAIPSKSWMVWLAKPRLFTGLQTTTSAELLDGRLGRRAFTLWNNHTSSNQGGQTTLDSMRTITWLAVEKTMCFISQQQKMLINVWTGITVKMIQFYKNRETE